jgi:hypothetical protein
VAFFLRAPIARRTSLANV